MSARRAVRRKPARGRRIALFGGTFDPIHSGHMAVARSALRRFRLDEIHFIPTARPPHKSSEELLPFPHRYAMVCLACAGHVRFVPSLVEAGTNGWEPRTCYSVDTVRHYRREVLGPGDRLYFLLGADSFLQIETWREYKVLLDLCDMVVANRPGFRMDALRRVIPPELLPEGGERRRSDERSIPLRRTTVYLLDAVASHVSATDVRRRAAHGRSLRGLVPATVEEYITKQALYRG